MTIEVLFGVVPDWLMPSSGFGDSYGYGFNGIGYGYGDGFGSGYGNGDICHGCLDGSGKAPDNDD